MFWSTKADIKMADRLLLYRVTDSKSNIIHSSSSQRDEIRRIPRDINYTDVSALYDFFDIMAAKAFGTTLNLCNSTHHARTRSSARMRRLPWLLNLWSKLPGRDNEIIIW